MTRSIRTELLKLFTTRLTYGLLAAGAGLAALIAVLVATGAGSGGRPPLSTGPGLQAVVTSTTFPLLLAAIFGATVSSGEFRHSTATVTYLATPRRARVLIAKAIAAVGVGLLFGLAATAVTTGVGLVFVAAKGYPLALPAATIARFAAGAVLASGLLAAVGVGVGSLIRGQLGAIISVFAWAFPVERVIGGLFRSAAPYLPYTAATTLAGIVLGSDPVSPATTGTGTAPLPFGAAAVLVAGVAALLSAVAARTTINKDV